MTWMSSEQAGLAGSSSGGVSLALKYLDWFLVFIQGDESERAFIKIESLSRTVHANQNLECGRRVLLSAACPVTGLYSGLSSVVSLIPGCCAGTKGPFTLTLTHGHPHHHRNQRRGIHSNSLISISLCAWQTGSARS